MKLTIQLKKAMCENSRLLNHCNILFITSLHASWQMKKGLVGTVCCIPPPSFREIHPKKVHLCCNPFSGNTG